MDNITIPIDSIIKNKLSINEYVVLYDVANGHVIYGLIDNPTPALVSLEKKGWIKISDGQVFLRDKSSEFFAVGDDMFEKWLDTYPIAVTKKFGGKRALSPASPDTILGQKLRRRWQIVFKKDKAAQLRAIKVLELQVAEMTKSGDLEYMVEAARWLNEGYHEKYSYMIDEEKPENNYTNEDYM